jgi:hypothetical protein
MTTPATNPSSSPAKPSLHPSKGSVQAQKEIHANKLISFLPGEDFCNAYVPTLQEEKWASSEAELLQGILATAEEHSLYVGDAPLIRLLNSVSRKVFNSMSTPPAESLLFYYPQEKRVKHPFHGTASSPDIVLCREPAEVFAQLSGEPSKLLWTTSAKMW